MKFEKYHGLGNDFVVVNYDDVQKVKLSNLAKKMCNRNTGIGADGMIVVKSDPLEMLFYNQDGTEAPMCGNGIRCFAQYINSHKIEKKTVFSVKTKIGYIFVTIESKSPFICVVNLGAPKYDAMSVPYIYSKTEFIGQLLNVDGVDYNCSSVFISTTHTVVIVDSIEDVDIESVGRTICNHQMFPKKTNVNFVQVLDENNIRVKTYERGVGITTACGTGVCASGIITNKLGLTKPDVNAHLILGTIKVSNKGNAFITGSSEYVFKGEFDYNE